MSTVAHHVPDSVAALMASSDLAAHEAERLLMAATGKTRAALHRSGSVSNDAAEEFRRLAAARRRGVPLQYLEGSMPFGPVDLAIDRRALIPRPETEQLWELAVHLADAPQLIVDVCTGSGNLAIALKHSFPQASVIGCDNSPEALELAEHNAARNGLEVTFLESDLFSALPTQLRGAVDLVVANPPYVAASEFDQLPAEIRDHEPEAALVAGPSGTEVLERIAHEARRWLAPGGMLVAEIGETQGMRVLELFSALDPSLRRDLAGRDRFVVGRREPDGPAPSEEH